ncbi:hypothetical protein ACWGN5_10840 [Streptomyces sp. NPDC055815]
MSIPGFAVEAPTRDTRTGDLIRPQDALCELELGPVCRNNCKGSHDFRTCVRKCLKAFCSEDPWW